MIQFYCPDILSTLTLPESDSGHAVRVLRMHEGDSLQVIDGKGTVYQCVLSSCHPKHATVEIVSSQPQPNPWSREITVCVAPTKNMDRMEWMTEKLTEIGINRIIPIKCDHSERKEIKSERLEKIAVSAMKQSLKAVLPEITPLTPFGDMISEASKATNCDKLIAYCDDYYPRVELACKCSPDKDTIILIGPEGDFSEREVKMAVDAGFIPVTLGKNRLRTETAAIVAVDTLHIISAVNNCPATQP